MNILPKKSWHVRNKDNINRVRRDEENARQEEIERQRKVALAEQEARTEALRNKARKHAGSINEKKESQALKHVDFFTDLQEKKGNKEHEAEKKAEQEKAEKSIGLLTYLGQSALDAQTSKPWYLKTQKESESGTGEDVMQRKRKQEFDKRQKASQDPLLLMSRYIGEKPSSSKKMRPDPGILSTKDRPKTTPPKQPSSTKTIEQLRAERLEREKAERARTEKLLAKLRGEKVAEEPVVNERERKYNSQFNPDCVRKPKHRRTYTY